MSFPSKCLKCLCECVQTFGYQFVMDAKRKQITIVINCFFYFVYESILTVSYTSWYQTFSLLKLLIRKSFKINGEINSQIHNSLERKKNMLIHKRINSFFMHFPVKVHLDRITFRFLPSLQVITKYSSLVVFVSLRWQRDHESVITQLISFMTPFSPLCSN